MVAIEANSKIGVGVVGVGNIADLSLRGYLNDDRCKVVAVCDIDSAKAKNKAEQWGVEKVYSDLEKFLNDDSIDAVEILTPTFLHHDHVIASAESGKHISCQKPIATSITDAVKMTKSASKADVIFRINECFYHFPPLVKAKQAVKDGLIGTPQQIRVHTLVGQTDSEFQVGLDPDGYTWRFNQESPGGHIFDDMIHKIAVSQWIVDQKIISIQATMRRQHTFFEPFVALLEYEDGNLLGMLDAVYGHNLWMNSSYYGADEFVEIIGDEGFIWVTKCTGELLNLPPLSIYDGKEQNRSFMHFESIDSDWGAGFDHSAKHFLDAMSSGSSTAEMTPLDATNALQICFAIYKAATTHSSVDPRSISEKVISPGGYP